MIWIYNVGQNMLILPLLLLNKENKSIYENCMYLKIATRWQWKLFDDLAFDIETFLWFFFNTLTSDAV